MQPVDEGGRELFTMSTAAAVAVATRCPPNGGRVEGWRYSSLATFLLPPPVTPRVDCLRVSFLLISFSGMAYVIVPGTGQW